LQPDFCFFVSTCLQNLVLKQKAVLSLCCILIVVKCCGWVIAVSGSSDGIYIYAVFVSWLSGESLLQIVGDHDTTCIIQPDFEDAAWSIMAVSFISLVAVSAVLATLFFVRRQQLQHLGTHLLSRVTSGMSATQVKSLPSIVFQGPGNGSGTAETCAICLEDYEIGEKLRLLPCNHEFHVVCIDRWLMARRPFCPVCKRDARTKLSEPAVSETTPLLAAAAGHTLPIPVTSSATQTSMVGSPPDVATQSQSSTPDMSLYFSPQGVDLC
jgi:E3 ubiquitin-protein ligase RNF13